jgi:hypothetical protein
MLRKVENKKVTAFSYIKLLIYFFIAILAIFLFRKWYIAYYDYQRTIPVINGVLAEINTSETHNYLQENDNIIIYMCTASDENCRNFEGKLKKYIVGSNYIDDVTYLNLSGIDTATFFKDLNKRYPYTKEINAYPAFIVFREGQIVDYLKIKTTTSFNEVRNLIENYGQE